MIERRLVSDALIAMLRSASPAPVGDGVLPPGNPTGYHIFTLVDFMRSGAPYADQNEDATAVAQVTSISAPDRTRPGSIGTRAQAEGLGDKVDRAYLGRDPATGLWLYAFNLAGVKCRSREGETSTGAMPDPGDGIINLVQRFRFDLTPA